MPPPALPELEHDQFMKLVQMRLGPMVEGKYRHWETLRHLPPPDGISHAEWWLALKLARLTIYRTVPLTDSRGEAFQYAAVEQMYRMLHEIDKNATGMIGSPDQVTNPETRDYYLVNSLMEESITSSQLEGASTTRKVAKEMLREGRKPRNRNEQMIYNNFEGMQFIRKVKEQPLTPQLVLEIQRILTERAISERDAAGRLRRADELIHVIDYSGTVLHVPPPAGELESRMAAMCRFANEDSEKQELFVHPVLRSILLHFWLAYDHPFVDGNGRTARALFYWSMARHGYWLCEYLSISRILKAAPSRYSRSFLYTESDDNDLTYFILYQLRVILRAIGDLMTFLVEKARQIGETRSLLREVAPLNEVVNYRQLALLTHALEHPMATYTVAGHQRSHNVSRQTARTDLMELERFHFLDMGKQGKRFVFWAPQDLRDRLMALKPAKRGGRRRRGLLPLRATR